MISPSKTNISVDQSEGFPMISPPEFSKSDQNPVQQQAVNYCFYKEYEQLQRKHNQISQYLQKLQKERDLCLGRLRSLQIEAEEIFQDRFRRVRGERGKHKNGFQAKKKNICEVEGCGKRYVSMGSMLQHMRIKHPEAYESRKKQKTIIQFLSCRQMGLEL